MALYNSITALLGCQWWNKKLFLRKVFLQQYINHVHIYKQRKHKKTCLFKKVFLSEPRVAPKISLCNWVRLHWPGRDLLATKNGLHVYLDGKEYVEHRINHPLHERQITQGMAIKNAFPFNAIEKGIDNIRYYTCFQVP